MKVSFYKHNLGDTEKASVKNSLSLEFLTTGALVHQFETEFSEYTGNPYTVGLTSCTAAMHLALLALDIGPGDEVITTPMTFAATTLAIDHTGATPVWVDVERHTGNIDAEKIEEAITDKTKAILPVHLYGQLCDMEKINSIAKKHNLYVIEDAAHALESVRNGVRVGELSDAACFSFYTTKSITCGEGGALTTNNKELADRVRCLRTHGMSSDASKRFNSSYNHWDLVECGWKYNMSNIQAAVVLPQIDKINLFRDKREQLFNVYLDTLSNISEVEFPTSVENSVHGRHLFTIWVDPACRDRLLKHFHDSNIGVTVNYRSINLLSALLTKYKKDRGSFLNSEKIGDSTISLPLYPRLHLEEIEYVCSKLHEFFKS